MKPSKFIPKKEILINVFICLSVSLIVIFFSHQAIIRRLELLSLDLRFKLARNIQSHTDIVIIEINDDDIAEVGSWPWKRSWHATLTKILSESSAKAIAFDILFTDKTDEFNDLAFSQAIKNAKNVYLPFAFQFKDEGFDLEKKFEVIPELKDYIKGSGFINILPDFDGVIRRVPLICSERSSEQSHFALKIASDFFGLNKLKLINEPYLKIFNNKTSINLPLDRDNKFIINWSGRWKDTFRHYSFLDIIRSYAAVQEGNPPLIDLSEFEDKICLVGVTATGLYDIKPTPLESLYPAVGINAQIINSILKKRFIFPASHGINISLIFILSFLGAVFVLRLSPLRSVFLNLIVASLYLLFNVAVFKLRGFYVELVLPLSANFISYFSVATYQQVANIWERKRLVSLATTDGLTGLFNIRYFKMLLEQEIKDAKQEKTKKFSLLMCDIDHFKKINDTYGHHIGDVVLKEVASVLRNSLRSSDVVARYGGEEMIALLKDTALNTAFVVAEKIRKNIEEQKIVFQDNTYNVTVSLGVAEFRAEDNIENIIDRVDFAMYKAKHMGRNKVCREE